MTLYEERVMIDRLRDDFYTPNEAEPEPLWCDNCGKDIENNGCSQAYRLPDQKECYCEKCFDQMIASGYFKELCEVF